MRVVRRDIRLSAAIDTVADPSACRTLPQNALICRDSRSSDARGHAVLHLGHECCGRVSGAVLCGWPQVAVGVERGRCAGVPERPLDGDDVAAGRNEAGGVVASGHELDPGDPGLPERGAPPVADGVLMRRQAGLPVEEPLVWPSADSVVDDVAFEQFHERRREEDGAFASVLGCSYVDLVAACALYLATYVEALVGIVELPNLEGRSFAEAQSGKRGDREERLERWVGRLK